MHEQRAGFRGTAPEEWGLSDEHAAMRVFNFLELLSDWEKLLGGRLQVHPRAFGKLTYALCRGAPSIMKDVGLVVNSLQLGEDSSALLNLLRAVLSQFLNVSASAINANTLHLGVESDVLLGNVRGALVQLDSWWFQLLTDRWLKYQLSAYPRAVVWWLPRAKYFLKDFTTFTQGAVWL